MFTDTIDSMYYQNLLFLEHIFAICKFSDYSLSAIPSFLFFLFAFLFLHNVLHRKTGRLTTGKVRFYREVGFQWMFFYMARMWIMCVKTTRWLVKWFDTYLMIQHSHENLMWLSSMHVRGALFSILTCMSLIPFAVVIATCMYQQNMPNFLMWVGEDPWLRSEIGISGHYLERPINFIPEKRKEYAYRSRRSMSVEHAFLKINPPIRNCKSLDAL